MTANGNAALTYKWVQAELDTQTYSKSVYTGMEITNRFDDANINYWADAENQITYLSRNAWDTSGDSIVTVEKDGVNYDVYVSKTILVDYDEYSIAYIPFEGYILDIHPRVSTPEEALAYIHEFDLVPVEEGTVATEVSVESDTAS